MVQKEPFKFEKSKVNVINTDKISIKRRVIYSIIYRITRNKPTPRKDKPTTTDATKIETLITTNAIRR